MSSEVQTAPFYELDLEDQSAVLAIVVVVGSLLSIASIVSKLLWRFSIFFLRASDYLLLAATVILLVQQGLFIYAADSGIGKHTAALGEKALNNIHKVSL